mmetsp:Transcript_28276/g.38202  ORF Transcript_28276/g.38202 Transcript_28276/m.38202 type:complete len:93 (-) Transcript_28276:142-420(-)
MHRPLPHRLSRQCAGLPIPALPKPATNSEGRCRCKFEVGSPRDVVLICFRVVNSNDTAASTWQLLRLTCFALCTVVLRPSWWAWSVNCSSAA